MTAAILAEQATEAFNRHGAFTARPVENHLAVELRNVDTGAHLTTVWLPAAGDHWIWPLTPDSTSYRTVPQKATLEELVRAVAVSVLDEAVNR